MKNNGGNINNLYFLSLMQLYFYRKNQLYGAFVVSYLYVDGERKKRVGVNGADSIELSPGKHIIQFKSWLGTQSEPFEVEVNEDASNSDLFIVFYYRLSFYFSFVIQFVERLFSWFIHRERSYGLLMENTDEAGFHECLENFKPRKEGDFVSQNKLYRNVFFLDFFIAIIATTLTGLFTLTFDKYDITADSFVGYDEGTIHLIFIILISHSFYLLIKHLLNKSIPPLVFVLRFIFYLSIIPGLIYFNPKQTPFVVLMAMFLGWYIYLVFWILVSSYNFNREILENKNDASLDGTQLAN